jgi:Flp pilus assembly protein TadG
MTGVRLLLLGRLACDQRGMAAVEFGLVGMFIVTFLIGIMEVATYVADQQDLFSAVHAAGRYAVVHGSSSSSPASLTTLEAQVGSNLSLLSAPPVSATASFSPNNDPGSTVTITGSYSWTPAVPFLTLPTVTITATSAATILN